MKDDRTKRRIGFIAEDMQLVIPEAVIWQNGQVESIDLAHLTALLTRGVQDLAGETASLSFRMGELEARMASSSGQTVIVQSSGGGIDILGTLANTALTKVQTLWATGDIVAEGIKKTYYSVTSAFDWEFDLATMVSGWASREITFAPNVDDVTRSLFSGNGAQAADNSKVDLQENGAYLATYGVDSTRGEIQLSGSSELVNGEAKIFFDFSFTSIISPEVPLKVLVTPTTNTIAGQLVVADKTTYGFRVQELNGLSNGKFDWLMIARRRGYEGAAAAVGLNVPGFQSSTGSVSASPELTTSPSPQTVSVSEPTPSESPTPEPAPAPSAEASGFTTLVEPSASPTPSTTPKSTPTPEPTLSPTPASAPEV
mgnify:CR=1 FL=1